MPISPLKSPLFEPTRSLQIPQSEIQLPSPVTSKTESSVSQEEPGVCKGSLLLSRPAGFKRVPRKEAKDNNRTRKRKNGGTSRLEAHFQSVSDQFRSQDDDERDIVYDPKTETLPDLPMYHPDFALAEGRTKEMIRQLQLVVSDSTEENAELKHMLTHLHNLQDPTYPRPSLVCFLGSSGVGKSCLINSLLDIDGLSLVSSGSVGTLVPITYQAALENQETRFVAQMELFPIDKCESLIKLSLKDYWNHFLKPEEEEGPRDTDQIDLGMPAKKTFLALFAHRPEFENDEDAETFLAQAERPDDPRVLKEMLIWTREIHSQLVNFIQYSQISAHSVEELSEKLEPFTQTCLRPLIQIGDDSELECSVWPLIKLITVNFDHHILDRHIILVDLPGLSDSNRHRVQMAQRLLKRADWTIVVHRNERADDDAAVKSYIEDAWRRKRDSVAVVITQIDKVNELKDKRTEFKVDEEEDLQYLSEQEKHINSEMTKIKKQLKTTPRKSEFLITLNEQKDLYAIHEKHIDIKRLEILIARRSRQLEHEFRTFHSALTKGTYAGGAHELPVFCVTSTEYMKHLEPYSPLEPPGVSVQRSGIPALRHFLLNLPHKSGRSLALKRHCDIRVRTLLSSMALSCSGFRPMLRRELLRKVVTNAVESMLMCCGRVIKEFCSDNILEVKDRFEIRESIWIEKAEALCDKWAKYNPAGHLAFVRNEGHWKTSACGTANWNNSLIQIMRDDMEPVLNHLCDHGLPHLRSEFLLTLDDILEDMQTQIRQCLRNTVQQQVKSATYLRFFDTLEKQKGSITASMDSLVEPLQRSTRLLISKCMSNNETAPFTANMQSLYLECEQSQATKGKGKRMTKHAVRCETFKMGVCDRRKGPYTEVKTCFLNKFGSVFTKWETRLRTEIYPIIEQIEHDFNQVFPEREESSLSKESQAVIGAAVRKAQAVLDGPIRESLAKAGIPMESTMPNMVQNEYLLFFIAALQTSRFGAF